MRRLKGMCAAGVILAVTLPTLSPPVLAVLAATLVAGIWHFRHVPARRRLVRHLAECIDALSGTGTAERRAAQGITLAKLIDAVRGRLGRSVRVARWDGRHPLGPVRIRYTPRFLDGEPSRRERLERVIDAKLPGSWSAEWATRRDRVTFTRTAELPAHVDYATVADQGGPRRLPVGVTHGGQTVFWRVDEHPHMLVGGRTRKGKSAAMRMLLVTWLRRGGRVMACDPKSVDLAWLAGRPGVLDVTTTGDDGSIAPMVGTLRRAVDEMADRYAQLRGAGVDRWQDMSRRPPPLAVVIDEAYDVLAKSADMSKPETAQRAEAFRHLRALASKGAGAGLTVVVATQQPYANVVLGSLRENLEARLLLGAARGDQSHMVLDSDDGELLAPDAPRGRAMARSANACHAKSHGSTRAVSTGGYPPAGCTQSRTPRRGVRGVSVGPPAAWRAAET